MTFAQFYHGVRRGWIRGSALRDLEASWAEETAGLRVGTQKQQRAIALLAKLNMFGMRAAEKDMASTKLVKAALEDEMGNTRAAQDGKKSAVGSSFSFNSFMSGGDSKL